MLSLQHCGGNKPPSNELTRSLQLYLKPDKGFSYAYPTKEIEKDFDHGLTYPNYRSTKR